MTNQNQQYQQVIWLVVIIAIIVLIFYFSQRCRVRCQGGKFFNLIDRFGQDASIRASAGWVSGPSYGYDPITQYAEQISEMYARQRAEAKAIGCDGICRRSGRLCQACFDKNRYKLRGNVSDNGETEDFGLMMMTDYPNLEDSPTKDIGPLEKYREGHYPYVIDFD